MLNAFVIVKVDVGHHLAVAISGKGELNVTGSVASLETIWSVDRRPTSRREVMQHSRYLLELVRIAQQRVRQGTVNQGVDSFAMLFIEPRLIDRIDQFNQALISAGG